jgi:phospholipid/cholesterol/gamma-HCH transport system ATP-binding protein
VIEYRDVHKSFDVPVLAGIDLTVSLGETFGIVGPSGCGKSVLLKTTVGLIKPDRGDVCIDGQSVFRSPRPVVDEILRRIGFVFQNAALFDSMTVEENVAFGLHEDVLRRLGKREVWRRVIRALEDVNLNPRLVVEKLPGELSGGMCKRVGLARAIIGRPEILPAARKANRRMPKVRKSKAELMAPKASWRCRRQAPARPATTCPRRRTPLRAGSRPR